MSNPAIVAAAKLVAHEYYEPKEIGMTIPPRKHSACPAYRALVEIIRLINEEVVGLDHAAIMLVNIYDIAVDGIERDE